MKKRTLGLLLALCMVLSLLPFTTAAAEILESGTCGENLTWTLDSDGLLTISGTGSMANYDTSYLTSPFYNRTDIRTVVIENGVMSIGHAAFARCSSLTSITIPDSVMSIGHYAFYRCSSLMDITIPDSVMSIEDCAFGSCTSLTDITIPDTLTSIANDTFASCSSLTSIMIPDSVTTIGTEAFEGCTGLTDITIPDSVTTIGELAFRGCSSLTSITIPDSVYDLGAGLFVECTALTEVRLPSGVYQLQSRPLYKNNSNEPFYGGFFWGCTSLETITLPDSLQKLGPETFSGCTSLREINGAEHVTVDSECFKNCTSLTEVDVGSVSGDSVFQGCTALKSVMIRNFISGKNVFQDCTALEKATILSATELGAYAIASGSSLKEVHLPKTLKTVAANAFRGTDTLTDVYYCGTEAEWNAINIRQTGNSALINAAKHFESHVLTEVPGTAATLTSEGVETYWKCEECGKLFSDAEGKYEIEAPVVIPKLTNPFEDVTEDQYYFEPVIWAVYHDPAITVGTDATHFSPEDTCTRAQAVTFLWRAMNCPEPETTVNPFTDVSESDWYYKPVLWAAENGITVGTGDGLFDPEGTCNRSQIVTFLWRATKPHDAISGGSSFVDVPADAWYAEPVAWAVENGITYGTGDGCFEPDSDCTRAQIVTFLYRCMK